MAVIGYVRVSSEDQDVTNQQYSILEYVHNRKFILMTG